MRVAVLEAVEIGFGGSGRNVGLVNAGMWVMPDDLPGALGPVYGDRLLTLLGDAPRRVFDLVERHGIACEINPAGTLHCAVGASGLAEIASGARAMAARAAPPVELLDADETAAKVGSAAYAGALLDRRAGTIQPLAYVRGLAAAALSRRRRHPHRLPGRRASSDERQRLDGSHRRRRRQAPTWIVARHQRLYARALAGGAGRTRPPALFQLRDGAARRQPAPLDPARAPGRLGHRARC